MHHRFFDKTKPLLAYLTCEVIACISLIILDFSIQSDDPNFDKSLFINRFYYFEKNIILFALMKFLKQEITPHAYNGLFNAGALMALYPQSQLQFPQPQAQIALRSSLILGGGLLMRTPIEMRNSEINSNEYVRRHYGKLLMGLIGIGISVVGAPIAASCYWIGGIIDLIRLRTENAGNDPNFLGRTIVPLQILIALPIKLALIAQEIKLPFTYLFDVAMAFILLAGMLIKQSCCALEQPADLCNTDQNHPRAIL